MKRKEEIEVFMYLLCPFNGEGSYGHREAYGSSTSFVPMVTH